MKLYTIQRVEQYICDALIASPEIPLGVNVLRLADALDREGVVQNTNNIVVRYVSSFFQMKYRTPMVYERTLTFELNFSCQQYLSSSGHDFATQLLAASLNTLVSGVPGDAGVQVSEGFSLTSETFTGITDNSQYTYTQTWEITISESVPYVALDPCVARGDCSQIFPGRYSRTSMPLAGVLDNEYMIFIPADPDGESGLGVRWEYPESREGNLVYICDPTRIFLPAELIDRVRLTWTGQRPEDGKIWVAITDLETNETIAEVLYCSLGQYLMHYQIDLWRRKIGNPTTPPHEVFDSTIRTGAGTDAGVLAITANTNLGYVYMTPDPTNPDAPQWRIEAGQVIGVFPEVFLQIGINKWIMVGQSQFGRGWIRETQIELTEINELWKLGCPTCGTSPDDLCP